MPVISSLVKALDSLPVYRRQDEGEDVSKNQETFVAARKLLARGGTIGICPEGMSHDAPGLKPIKTGAARIALASVATDEVQDLKIVPAGLYYTAKTRFRSSALLYFGASLSVTPVQLETDGTPPRDAVRELSKEIEAALRTVILDAEHEDALIAISRAERIFTAGKDEDLTDALQLQQRFNKAYSRLQQQLPDRLRKLEVRMIRFEEELNQIGIDEDELLPPSSTLRVFRAILLQITWFLLVLGPALAGTITHYPAYQLGGYLAQKFSQDSEDVVSTIKIVSAMLLFPITWLVVATVTYFLFGWLLALAALVVVPLCGYTAMKFFEELDRSLGSLRALMFFLLKRRFFVRLLAERNAIRNEIIALGKESAD